MELKSQVLNRAEAMFSECSKSSGKSLVNQEKPRLLAYEEEGNHKKTISQEPTHKFTEHSQNSRPENA